ncbi:hydrogenase maturation protease [soil metagenome]
MQEPSILIAGVGNELKQDDAFGVEFAKVFGKLEHLPERIKVLEVGIGGIHLVQELHYKYDILVLVDAVDWEGVPGELFFKEVESIIDIEKLPVFEKRTFLADMHYTSPMRALMLAKALDVLPKQVFIFGCKAKEHDDFAIGMSDVMQEAIPKAVIRLKEWLKI